MSRFYFSSLLSFLLIALFAQTGLMACTGIRLIAKDGGVVYARTMEWGAFDLNSRVTIIQRNYHFTGLTPAGMNGKSYVTKYGVVGLDALNMDYLSEGMNEKGLATGLFYHNRFAEYPAYVSKDSAQTISSLDVTNYILSQFASVEEVKKGMEKVTVVQPPPIKGLEGVSFDYHWMITDTTGASIVIEFRDHKMVIYDAILGVITNNPYYDWHLTNLRNYINLSAMPASPKEFINTALNDTLYLRQLGAGSGMLGLPGDNTPPSRFVRAAIAVMTARPLPTAKEAVYEAFRIMDNFQLPVGFDAAEGSSQNAQYNTKGLRSSTLWTTAWNLTDRTLNYHTQHNRRVRFLNLKKIAFYSGDKKPTITHIPLDVVKEQDKDDITP